MYSMYSIFSPKSCLHHFFEQNKYIGGIRKWKKLSTRVQTNKIMSQLEYQDKVFKGLLDLPSDGVIVINQQVKPENRSRFIETVKHLIDCNYSHSYRCYFVFKHDYSEVKKVNF